MKALPFLTVAALALLAIETLSGLPASQPQLFAVPHGPDQTLVNLGGRQVTHAPEGQVIHRSRGDYLLLKGQTVSPGQILNIKVNGQTLQVPVKPVR